MVELAALIEPVARFSVPIASLGPFPGCSVREDPEPNGVRVAIGSSPRLHCVRIVSFT